MKKTKSLSEVSKIIAGQSPKSEYYNSNGDGLPFFQGKADFGKIYPEVRYWCVKPTKIALKNDILISVRAPVGPTNIAKDKCCIGRGLMAIRANDDVLNYKFLLYYLRHFEPEWSLIETGSTFKAINKKVLESIQIPLPLLDEQQKIVEKLDRAQRLIDIDKEMLAKYDQLIQSIFLDMFGDPISNPKNWPIVALGNLLSKIGSGSTPRGGSKIYQEQGVKLIRSQNVYDWKLILEDVAYISPEIHSSMTRSKVQNGDVLLNITGASIGRVCNYKSNEEANVNQHVCILRPNPKRLISEYLVGLLSNQNYKKALLSSQSGGTREAYNFAQIKEFSVIYPPIELQEKFLQALELIAGEKNNLNHSLLMSTYLFNSIMNTSFN